MNLRTKKTLGAALLVGLCGVMSSCHDDDDELNITVRLNQTEITYGEDDVWSGVATNQSFSSQYVVFSHAGEVGPWGLVWSGFTPARVADTAEQTDWMSHQFQIMTGGGMSGKGTPYIVAYWNTQENETTPLESRSCRLFYSNGADGEHYEFLPMSVYVTNTAYSYYTMRDGNAFAEKFTPEDHLTLIAHGVHKDGTESTVTFSLAGKDAAGDVAIVDSWEQFSLSPLGRITDLYFTMESNLGNQWGMTAPSYFAIDCLSLRAKLPGK